jgi:hypothetical protein
VTASPKKVILGHIDLQCDTRIQANVIIVPKAVT